MQSFPQLGPDLGLQRPGNAGGCILKDGRAAGRAALEPRSLLTRAQRDFTEA